MSLLDCVFKLINESQFNIDTRAARSTVGKNMINNQRNSMAAALRSGRQAIQAAPASQVAQVKAKENADIQHMKTTSRAEIDKRAAQLKTSPYAPNTVQVNNKPGSPGFKGNSFATSSVNSTNRDTVPAFR